MAFAPAYPRTLPLGPTLPEWAKPRTVRREIGRLLGGGKSKTITRKILHVGGFIGAKAITENGLIGGTASEQSSTDAASYVTGSFTPTSGSVQIATCASLTNFSGASSVPTATGWTAIDSATFNTSYQVSMFWKQTSGSQTMTWSFGATQASCMWTVQEFAGCDAGAPINTNHNKSTGSSTTPATTLSAFGSSNNGTFSTASAVNSSALSGTAGTGWTEIYDFNHSEAFAGNWLYTEWRADNDTAPGLTISLSSPWAIVACELVAASAGGATFFKFYKNMMGGIASAKHGLGRGHA